MSAALRASSVALVLLPLLLGAPRAAALETELRGGTRMAFESGRTGSHHELTGSLRVGPALLSIGATDIDALHQRTARYSFRVMGGVDLETVELGAGTGFEDLEPIGDGRQRTLRFWHVRLGRRDEISLTAVGLLHHGDAIRYAGLELEGLVPVAQRWALLARVADGKSSFRWAEGGVRVLAIEDGPDRLFVALTAGVFRRVFEVWHGGEPDGRRELVPRDAGSITFGFAWRR